MRIYKPLLISNRVEKYVVKRYSDNKEFNWFWMGVLGIFIVVLIYRYYNKKLTKNVSKEESFHHINESFNTFQSPRRSQFQSRQRKTSQASY